jgi:type III pantothenate kinase
MLLAIDIGNSLIKFGVFDEDHLVDKFTIPTKRDYRPDEIHLERLKPFEIDTVIVGSVVPELIKVVGKASETQFNVTPTFIDDSTDFGLKINYDPPESVGIDRLINASAASKKYGTPVIVCSFGTATVIDAVNKDKAFLGGIIAPGVKTMAAALRENAAQLPAVEIKEPDTLIGNSTESAIQSGIVNGHIAMAEGLIQKIISEFGTRDSKLKVVATGGFAKLIASRIDAISEIDENLTLDGLRLLVA